MDYYEKMQSVLVVVCDEKYKNSFISDIELRDAVGFYSNDITIDLIELKYITPNSGFKNKALLNGFSARESGIKFLKDGGFKRERLYKKIKFLGGITLFIITSWTFVITLRGCIKEQSIEKNQQLDSLNQQKADTVQLSASSTVTYPN